MPLYHFNISDGADKLDRVGMKFPDLQSAQREALRLAGEVLIDHSHEATYIQEWGMDVTDRDGLILFRLDFIMSSAAALPTIER